MQGFLCLLLARDGWSRGLIGLILIIFNNLAGQTVLVAGMNGTRGPLSQTVRDAKL
jgi:hypothetical protein